MTETDKPASDLNALVVPRLGSLQDSGDPFEPYRLPDGTSRVVGPITAYLRDLQAHGSPGKPRSGPTGWRCCVGSDSWAVGVC